MNKERIDVLIAERGLTESRTKGQRLIRAGEVRVDGQIVDKPGTRVSVDAEITLEAKPPFVSRGGKKLEAALNRFPIDVTDAVVADVGASTGGAPIVCSSAMPARSTPSTPATVSSTGSCATIRVWW
jgi:23S rRNA (cytidine1920-2'-O)/16S rRNA (cytidine1409-2'-O)-methyltransferase